MSVILMILGIALFINGVFLCFMSNITTGIIMTVIIGVLVFVYGIKFREINSATEKGKYKIIKYAVLAFISAGVLLVGFIAMYGQIDTVDYSEDAVIVLGAGVHGDRVSLPLKFRLDKAAEYHRKNPDALICVTGGKGFQETVTEASAMKKYLLSCGVDENIIITEEKATSTNENMRFSKEILDGLLGEEYDIAVITNGFHIYRSTSIARSEGFDNVHHMHAGLQWYNIIPCYLRECLAVLKLWVFG